MCWFCLLPSGSHMVGHAGWLLFISMAGFIIHPFYLSGGLCHVFASLRMFWRFLGSGVHPSQLFESCGSSTLPLLGQGALLAWVYT